jgi:hypothetical protein
VIRLHLPDDTRRALETDGRTELLKILLARVQATNRQGLGAGKAASRRGFRGAGMEEVDFGPSAIYGRWKILDL